MDTIFTSPTGDGTAILRGHPSHAKVSPLAVQRKYLHFSVILRPWVMVQPRESNPRPPARQSCALPTELIPPVQSETQNNVKFQNMYTEILLYNTDEYQPLMLSNQSRYTVVLSHRFRSRSYEEKLSRKSGSPSSWVNGKNSWTLCPSQQCSHILWLFRLDWVDPAGRVKVFIWRNVGSARTVTLPSQRGEPAARRVTFLAKPTFFSHL